MEPIVNGVTGLQTAKLIMPNFGKANTVLECGDKTIRAESLQKIISSLLYFLPGIGPGIYIVFMLYCWLRLFS